jgi:hypothetical protein
MVVIDHVGEAFFINIVGKSFENFSAPLDKPA